MNYIINLFGTGIRYWICNIPLDEFEEMNKIRLNHKVEWENLLFDFDFLRHFGYKHWSELSSHSEQMGLLLLTENRIEIKLKTKFIDRFKAHELLNTETLFPLFQTNYATPTFKSFANTKPTIILQFEKGLIGKYHLETDHFDMNDLQFELTEINDLMLLSDLNFQGRKLLSKLDDTVVTGTKVIILD